MVRYPQVLANDVVEFMPYVFQIFSQLLELRPAGEFSAVSGVAQSDQNALCFVMRWTPFTW